MGQIALSSSSLHGKTGEEPSGAGGGRFGRPGPRRHLGVEGKGGGGPAGSIPNRSSARGGLRWPGHCGRWRPWAGVPEGRRRPRGGGKHWWASVVPKPTLMRAEDGGEGCSAVAGGGDGERWRCRLEKEGLGGGVGYGEGGGAWGVLRGPLNRRPRRWSGEQALGGVNGDEARPGDAMARRGGTGGASTLTAGGASIGDVTPRAGGDRRRRRCAVVVAAVPRQRRSARARAGVEHGARASGAGRSGSASVARRCGRARRGVQADGHGVARGRWPWRGAA